MWELSSHFRTTLLFCLTWLCKWYSVFTGFNLSFDSEFWRIEVIIYSVSTSLHHLLNAVQSRSNHEEENIVIEQFLVMLMGTQLSIHTIVLITWFHYCIREVISPFHFSIPYSYKSSFYFQVFFSLLYKLEISCDTLI